MKKMNFKLMTISVLAMMVFTACEKENGGSGENDPQPTDQLIGELVENKTLETGLTYYLTGGYHVKSGVTLTIEPGVTIIAKNDKISDYILIEQGAKINAVGTAEDPIVMTSESKISGAWGGVHICGNAKINVAGGTGLSEIGGAVYGGNDDTDNSGILKYIRLEYTGYAISEDKESNGFTFYGVGNGTTAQYLQAYKGADDGFEWFGGSLNAKYLVSTDSGDDSFDWTYGWRGKGQFWVATQAEGESCDCLMEADNNSKDFIASPISFPTISNVTLIGNNSSDNTNGVKFRKGTMVKMYNALVTNKENLLVIESDETQQSFVDNTSVLKSVVLSGLFGGAGDYTTDMFLNKSNSNMVSQGFSFTGKFVGTLTGGTDVSADGFFTKTSFIGAVPATDDWTKGWVIK